MKKTFLLMLTLWTLCAFSAQAKLHTETVEYKHGDVTLEGFVAYNDAIPEKRPGVLVVHAWKGLGDYAKKRARQLAEMGYIAFAADIYGKGVRPKTREEAGAQAGKYKQDRALLRSRVNAGLETLQKHPFVDPHRIAAIGYCFGGTTVLELARSGADVKGVVSFHGGLDSPNPADGKNIRAKVLALHGADDPFVSAEDLAAFQEELRQANVDWRLVSYGGAVHSFTNKGAGNDNSQGAAYNEKADQRSWEEMKQFFHEIFEESSTPIDSSQGASLDRSSTPVPKSPKGIQPLLVGETIPDIPLKTLEGKVTTLSQAIGNQSTALIFYRGGWCPYCITHLSQLAQIESQLVELGFQILAITPDSPEKLRETLEKHPFSYTLLSDDQMKASQAFGVAFRVDQETVEKYRTYKVDVPLAPDGDFHWLPVPAVFLVGKDKTIAFQYANPNYQVRLEADTLLSLAKSLVKSK